MLQLAEDKVLICHVPMGRLDTRGCGGLFVFNLHWSTV